MNKILIALAFLLVAGGASAQTAVDRLTADLDRLGAGRIDGWKYSTNFAVDPTSADFDDSAWQPIEFQQRLYIDSCWIRTVLTVPATILGEPVKGRVRLLLTVDDLGTLYVDGENRGKFLWDGDIVVSDDIRPGRRYALAIKAINTGGPLRLIGARLLLESAEPAMRRIQDLSLSFKVGQKLLSFDTYQTNARVRVDPGIDKSPMDREEKKRLNAILQGAAARIDVDALRREEMKRFDASVEEARREIAPVRDFARRFTLYFDANAHIDAAWLWREKETWEVCRNTFSSVINMFRARPDFTYTQSSAQYYAWMEAMQPSLFREIGDAVRSGRWEVIGGMWVEPDCNLPSGISWSRQLLYAKNYFREKFGVDVTVGWNPDSFGYNGNMPEFYRQAGIDAFITQKIGWNETNVFPYRLFWWESQDGSRILSYFPFDYVNTIGDPFRLVDWLRQFEANTGFANMLVLFGVGDHGGGPSLEMLRQIDRLASLDIFPRVEHGTAKAYLDRLRAQDLTRLPVWKDELYLEYHQGTFTTQADMKRNNRRNEFLLSNAECFGALARPRGGADYRRELRDAWKKLMLTQFHDILPGSSIREVYIDASETHRQAGEEGAFVLRRSLETLAGRIGTAAVKDGEPLLVFNPCAWERSDIVEYPLEEGDTAEYALFMPRGVEVPVQRIAPDPLHGKLLFRAENVPPLGYATYVLRKRIPSRTASALTVSEQGIENEFFRIGIDPKSGWITSIFDKRLGKELVKGNANELQLLEDLPKDWDAWNVGWTGVTFPMQYRRAEIVESGPVRAVLRIYHDFLRPGVRKEFPTEDFPSSFFTQDIILSAGVPRIDFRTGADWWEDRIMLKAAFPLTCTDSAATYEIPFGTIRRSTLMRDSRERARVEVPAQKWVDLSGDDYGVSILNRSTYGHDIKGNTIRLSLLRSPKWPDPTADRGKHAIEYAMYPHAKSWREANSVRAGYDFNNPLIAFAGKKRRGALPLSGTFLRVDAENALLASLKQAEKGEGWILQFYESMGRPASVNVEFPSAPKRAWISNTMEERGASLPVSGKRISFSLLPYQMMTIEVEP